MKIFFRGHIRNLERFRNRFLTHGHLDREEIQELIALTSHGDPRVVNPAMDLLLTPPTSREIFHYETLKECLLSGEAPLHGLPAPMLEFLMDGLAMAGKLPSGQREAGHLLRFLAKPPAHALCVLFGRAYPLHPFLQAIPATALTHGIRASRRRKTRARWRILRKRLLGTSPPPALWAMNTLRDLNPLCRVGRESRGTARRVGSWLLRGRPLLAKPAGDGQCQSMPPLKESGWNGLGSAALAAFDRLLDHQREELRAIRALSREVSRRTGRVVVSLHNASLGAMGGWAHDALSTHFPHVSVLETFMGTARAWRDHLRTHREDPAKSAQEIGKHWEQRILHPKILRALWESRVRCALDPSLEATWKRDMEMSASLMELPDPVALEEGSPYGWPQALAPHQCLQLETIAAGVHHGRSDWSRGLLSFAGLVRAGRELLRAGDLDCFVLPWIDKFFISSRRSQDRAYITSVVHWLEKWAGEPIILFWEDSARARSPSFLLALEALRRDGHPFRGIGIFDAQGSGRDEALDIITREHRKWSVFALRPFSDAHHPTTLARILDASSRGPLPPYDSSWKDDLCFLYAGTQIAPLVSIQTEMEKWAPWVVVQGRKMPFGGYLRRRLREGVVPIMNKPERLDLEFSRWARLE